MEGSQQSTSHDQLHERTSMQANSLISACYAASFQVGSGRTGLAPPPGDILNISNSDGAVRCAHGHQVKAWRIGIVRTDRIPLFGDGDDVADRHLSIAVKIGRAGDGLRLQSQVDLDQLAGYNKCSEPIQSSKLTNMSQKSLSTIPGESIDRHEGLPSSLS